MGIIKDGLYQLSWKGFLRMFRTQNIFPYYHLVRDTKVDHIENLYNYKDTQQFINDLSLLVKNYKAIDPKDFIQNRKISNGFLLSFDDGLEEVYSVVFPILKKYKIKALFFINPDFVDNKVALYKHSISLIIKNLKENNFNEKVVGKVVSLLEIEISSNKDLVEKIKGTPFSQRHKIKELMLILEIDEQKYLREQKPYISKSQIKEMLDDGHYFGGHTMSHPPLNQLTHEDQKAEIINSIDWLKENFDITYSLFAFPFSDKGISKKLITELFLYDSKLLLFGNSGIKKDIDNRIIHRFSIENPTRLLEKVIVTEHFYKLYNMVIGKYKIRRG